MKWQDRALELWLKKGDDEKKLSWAAIEKIIISEYPELKLKRDFVRGFIRKTPEYKLRQTSINEVKQHRKTIMINPDRSQISECDITCTEEQMNDVKFLLRAHGFNPDEWELLYCKNSVYNVQLKGGATDTYYASKITVKPSDKVSEKDALEHFIEQAAKYSPVESRITKQDGEYIGVVGIYDLHLGQLSWGAESGENYDSKIAVERGKKLTYDTLSKMPKLNYRTIYIICGNDFFNSDTTENTTTKGTQQFNDVRHQKMFDMGCDLLVWIIDTFRSAFADVEIEVFFVPGNHEKMTMYHAMKYLFAWFRKDKTTKIDISPRMHKGVAFGITALLFTHGEHEIKNLDWVYTEFRHLIGSTKVTEIHSGHQHRIRVEEKNGAIIKVNPSAAALSGWSYGEGYGATAQTISRIYSKDNGLEYEIYSKA